LTCQEQLPKEVQGVGLMQWNAISHLGDPQELKFFLEGQGIFPLNLSDVELLIT
jgi:cupin superfamily acireductone dioxygenase involved in methionine salvage